MKQLGEMALITFIVCGLIVALGSVPRQECLMIIPNWMWAGKC